MSDRLYCNAHKCNTTLTGRVWVTRCLHVFCSEHGAAHFHNDRTQVNCPVCNEVNARESDVLLCNTNPNDMTLAGLRPEKILRLVERSFKLWKCQLDAERNHDCSKIYMLSRQVEENTNHFKRSFHEKEIEQSSQVARLQANYNDIMMKLRQVNQELEITKSSLRKYKVEVLEDVCYENELLCISDSTLKSSSHAVYSGRIQHTEAFMTSDEIVEGYAIKCETSMPTPLILIKAVKALGVLVCRKKINQHQQFQTNT